MSSNRLHVAAVLSLACLLASGCALDPTAPGAASDGPVASTSEAANRGNTMIQGEVLNPGDTLYSGDGRTYLTMQTDGNLVLRFSHPGATWTKIIWASNTYGNPGAYAIFQVDGNFVVYTPAGCTMNQGIEICNRQKALWAAGTNPSGHSVQLQDDGNLVVYTSSENPVWATGTNGVVPPASSCNFANFCPTGTWWQTCQSVGDGSVNCSEPNICDTSYYSCGNILNAGGAEVETCTNHLGQLECTLSTGQSVNYVDTSGCPYCGGPVD